MFLLDYLIQKLPLHVKVTPPDSHALRALHPNIPWQGRYGSTLGTILFSLSLFWCVIVGSLLRTYDGRFIFRPYLLQHLPFGV